MRVVSLSLLLDVITNMTWRVKSWRFCLKCYLCTSITNSLLGPNLSEVTALYPYWIWQTHPFLGAFAKLRKATSSFVIFVCPSVLPSFLPSFRMEQLGSHCSDFYEIWYLGVFRKLAEKIHVSLNSDKNNVYLHKNQHTFRSCLAQSFLKWESRREN
jgi:hypothetical protein